MVSASESLHKRYQHTLDQIRHYAKEHRRDSADIQLIAVSKKHSAENIAELVRFGHREFGENYLQEAQEKIPQVASLCSNIDQEANLVWHFVGHIQSRKCKDIARLFDWVHTIESEKVAKKLNQHREGMDPLNVLIQLNLQQEDTKSGIGQDQLESLAATIDDLPRLRLRGLMILPRPESDFDKQREVFAQCRNCLEKLSDHGFAMDQLSMGMTDDMEAAIAEGATQIRIGTAIFGPRPD